MVFWTVTLILLALIGMVNTGYLIWKNKKGGSIVCPLKSNCQEVLESKWNSMFFVKNEILGFVFYVFVLIATIILIFKSSSPSLSMALVIAAEGAFLVSAFLTVIQVKVLKSYCFYCLISVGINFLVLLNIIFL